MQRVVQGYSQSRYGFQRSPWITEEAHVDLEQAIQEAKDFDRVYASFSLGYRRIVVIHDGVEKVEVVFPG